MLTFLSPRYRQLRPRRFYLLVTVTFLITIRLLSMYLYSHDKNDDLLNYPSRWPEFDLILPYLEPTQVDQEVYLVVVVNSAATGEKHRSLRMTIRDSWGASSSSQDEHHKWKLFFALGRSKDPVYHKANLAEAAVYNDVIIGNFTDVYDNVVMKTYMSHLWAISRFNCKYILKCDDDVYIRVNQLVNWLVDTKPPRPFYGGFVSPYLKVPRDPKSKWFITYEQYSGYNWPPFCHGAFHVLSTDIVPNTLNFTKKQRPIINDDAFIGVTMSYLGVQATRIPGFDIEFKHPKRGRTECELLSGIAIGHKVDPAMMRAFHSFYRLSTPNLQCTPWQNLMSKFHNYFEFMFYFE